MPIKPLWPLIAFSPVFLFGSLAWAAECRLGATLSSFEPARVRLQDPTNATSAHRPSFQGTRLGLSEGGYLGFLPLRLDPRLSLQPSSAQTPSYLFGQALDGQFQDQIRMEGGGGPSAAWFFAQGQSAHDGHCSE